MEQFSPSTKAALFCGDAVSYAGTEKVVPVDLFC